VTLRRNLILVGGALVIFAAVFAGRMVFQPGPTDFAVGPRMSLADYRGANPAGVPPELAAADPVVRGQYLARAADCAACHTAKGGTPYAGGRPFKLPFGTIYTPNITPDRETGIGAWSDAEFLRAVHDGIGRDGKRLYPAFPYASYAMLSDADVLAIKAYLFSLKPVRAVTIPNTFAFPFNQRWLMAIWSTLFNRTGEFRPVTSQSATWNRGAYLVEAAGHCGECHSPRNLMQAMNQRQKFSGGAAEGWNAYNISQDKGTGIGGWSQLEIATYLKTGHSPGRGTASGPMAEVVELSTRHLIAGDLDAMALYLKSVPARQNSSLPAELAGPAPAAPKAVPGLDPAGRKIFEGACASCHGWSGAGSLIPEAQLTGARAVNDPSAVNVAQMILAGTGKQRGGRPFMPGFGAIYSDTEVAAVANYVTARFGSKPSRVTPKQVATLRLQN
jgi:mono/diheme cytochrome c family protein